MKILKNLINNLLISIGLKKKVDKVKGRVTIFSGQNKIATFDIQASNEFKNGSIWYDLGNGFSIKTSPTNYNDFREKM